MKLVLIQVDLNDGTGLSYSHHAGPIVASSEEMALSSGSEIDRFIVM